MRHDGDEAHFRRRLVGWQRSLRHLRGVALAGLPFDTGAHGAAATGLFVEILAPPTGAVRPRLRLWARADGTVEATLCVVAEPPTALCRTPTVTSPMPRWEIDPATLPQHAAALRSAVVLVWQAAPGSGAHTAGVAGAARVVWQRTVRLPELKHIYAKPAALAAMLAPAGALLLVFTDGVCAAAADLQPLAEAGLLRPSPPLEPALAPTTPLAADGAAFTQQGWVERAIHVHALGASLRDENARVRRRVEVRARLAHGCWHSGSRGWRGWEEGGCAHAARGRVGEMSRPTAPTAPAHRPGPPPHPMRLAGSARGAGAATSSPAGPLSARLPAGRTARRVRRRCPPGRDPTCGPAPRARGT